MYSGEIWEQIISPTNKIITALCVQDSGEIVGTGQNGLLIKGRFRNWKIIETTFNQSLWSAYSFSGKLLISSLKSMY